MTPIGEWLKAIDLEKYAGLFEENAVGLDVLPDLTENDLAGMGVVLGDRKRILRAIRDMGAMPEAAPGTGAERRILTVFFSDLVGSTDLAHRLEVEDLRTVIGAYQAVCRSEILRFEGQVARTFGDGVLAYFGYPLAHEDDAERAASAGLAIIERMRSFEPPGGTPLQVRIGLATGPAIVEDMIGGRWADETATGRTINLATRIQEQAQPGAILVDEATRASLRRAFRCVSAGERTLKGFTENLPLWTVAAREVARTRFEAAQGAQAIPLQGRQQELAELYAFWRRAAAGKGTAVLLSADAGMGKSRLLHEMHRGLDGVNMLVGECVSYGAQTPYQPILSMLNRFAGISIADTPVQRRTALASALTAAGAPAAASSPSV